MTDPNHIVDGIDLTKGPRGTPIGEVYDPESPIETKLAGYRDLAQLDSEAALMVERAKQKPLTFAKAYAELRRIADGAYCTLHVRASWMEVYKRTELQWQTYIDKVGASHEHATAEAALDEIRKLTKKAPPADLATIDLEKIPMGRCDNCDKEVPADELQHRFSSSGETVQCEECLAP